MKNRVYCDFIIYIKVTIITENNKCISQIENITSESVFLVYHVLQQHKCVSFSLLSNLSHSVFLEFWQIPFVLLIMSL